MDLKIPKDVKKFLKPLKNFDYYFVGGIVRDTILKRRDIKDFDILVLEDFDRVIKILGGNPIILNERFKTARYFINGKQVDINVSDSLYTDLQRRDFTINSIALTKNKKLFDPLNGLKDLKKGVIKITNENSLKDDSLRILRAYRFKYFLNFKFSKETKKSIKENRALLKDVAKERILRELEIIVGCEKGYRIFRDLKDDGIILILFPFLKSSEKFFHKKYRSNYLLNHLINTVEAVDRIIDQKGIPLSWKKYFMDYKLDVYLSAFFHDFEKPECFKKIKGKQTFFNHDILGGEKIKELLKSYLKISNESQRRISNIIKNHMRPHFLLNSTNVTHKGYYKLLRDSGNDFEGVMLVSMADKLSSEGLIDRRYINLYRRVMKIKRKVETKKIEFVTGKDIIGKFALKPGPLIGKLIEKGNLFAIENNISEKEKILNFLEDYLKNL